MCKLIADLLGSDKRIVKDMFRKLESSCGEPGIDVRLTAEIYGKIHMKMRELGLDPNDTTHSELYQALLSLASKHDSFLRIKLGIGLNTEPHEITASVANVLNNIKINKNSWTLKQTSIKRMLKQVPPKSLMKSLHYRSLDSMLKREAPNVLLALATHTENEQWQNKVQTLYKKLSSNDFEQSRVQFVNLHEKKWTIISKIISLKYRTNVIHSKESAVVLYLPSPEHNLDGLVLASLLMGLHYINEVRQFSSFCKFHQFNSDFGDRILGYLNNDKGKHLYLAGHSINWRILHKYYGAGEVTMHPEMFEPHVQPEDLSYKKAEEILYRIEPALHFWHDLDYVGISNEGDTLSFSLTDMMINLVNKLTFDQKVSYHMQASLWNEIYIRYFGQPALQRQVIQQLDESNNGLNFSFNDMELAW